MWLIHWWLSGWGWLCVSQARLSKLAASKAEEIKAQTIKVQTPHKIEGMNWPSVQTLRQEIRVMGEAGCLRGVVVLLGNQMYDVCVLILVWCPVAGAGPASAHQRQQAGESTHMETSPHNRICTSLDLYSKKALNFCKRRRTGSRCAHP